jgi:hypothetical protein
MPTLSNGQIALALCLALCLMLPIAPTIAPTISEAAEINWTLEDGVLTLSGQGAMPDYDEYENPAPWAAYADEIERVQIEPGITGIGAYAFCMYTNLSEVTIAEGVTTIGEWAFYGCTSLTSIALPEGVTAIGDFAFRGCFSLESIQLPTTLVDIGEETLAYTRLSALQLPASTVHIGANAFQGAPLMAINVAAENPSFTAKQGVLFSKDGTALLFYPRENSRIRYTIPRGVQTIGARAFEQAYRLGSVTIPDGVTTIEEAAFANAGAARITLPASVAHIGTGAFRGVSLQEILVDQKNPHFRSVEGVLFSQDGTELVLYPAGKKGDHYAVPEGVATIAPYAFYEAPFAQVELPDSLTTIGEFAFAFSALTQITVPDQVQTIQSRAFFDCDALETAALPDSLTDIGHSVFYDCDALTIHAPEGSLALRYAEENGIANQAE